MDRISFKINGSHRSVGCEISSDLTLLDYIRNTLELRGTKYMCREGGCGACIVTTVKSPNTEPLAVNSCLVSVTSCQDWDITTVEKVGNRLDGYHVVQKILAENNGTQCGHCTPGWIMSMYSLLKSKKELTMLEVEQSFGSNICRCTGYRPILDAFKQFAKDSPNPKEVADIEDINKCKRNCKICVKVCKNTNNIEDDWCFLSKEDLKGFQITKIKLKDNKIWVKVHDVRDIFTVLGECGTDSYMLVAGNTAKGVYPIDEYPRVLIDISTIPELKLKNKDQNFMIGSGTTLSRFIEICLEESKDNDFSYLFKFYKHIQLVAHIPVRNIGTIAGNLMIKHDHNEFPSDIFLLLETVGAELTIASRDSIERVTMQDFLKLNMKGRVILSVMLPPLSQGHKLVTFKIMARAQNVHAIVNAGFIYELGKDNKVLKCRIVYGNLSPLFIRAETTEAFLIEKNLFLNETLQSSVKIMAKELIVKEMPPEPSAKYRKQLAIALYYKSLLTICPVNRINARYRSGSIDLRDTRPVSQGRQYFETDKTLWPLNQPLEKLEALIQCSGEAPYTEDILKLPREVFAAFVLTTVAKGQIVSVDTTKASKYPGVITYFSAEDIPGLNSFYAGDRDIDISKPNEVLFCDGNVEFYNQPIGIIVAITKAIAERATKLVTVKYANLEKPVLDVNKAKNDPKRVQLYQKENGKSRGNDTTKVLKGNISFYGQYHFPLETLVSVTQPTEQGLAVHAATQWTDSILALLLNVLNIDGNRIDVFTRRLGGAFGIKVSRTSQIAIASALAAYKLNRPCRFIAPLTTVTRAFGKRLPCSSDYEVGVDDAGVIQYVEQKHYEDYGYLMSEIYLNHYSFEARTNCYRNTHWNYYSFIVTTDNPKNTWCRAPGTIASVAIAETLMERISYELGLDSIEVRLANLDPKHNELKDLIETLQIKSNYQYRKTAVNEFNSKNRWKKRGLRLASYSYTSDTGQYLDVKVSLLQADGSAFIVHGGIEMGQGINTKAAQVCAYCLGIPVTKVKVKGNSTILTPNVTPTVASLTSQNVCLGVKRCCEELLKRLEPIKKQYPNLEWGQLLKQAVLNDVQLQAHGYVDSKDLQDFNIYGAVIAEVEVDLLTGESQVLRVDLLQDAGQSTNPALDIGQVEGAFIMGLGFWTCEELVYNENTGELLTDRTWNYQVPQARDIPQDFRVTLRKKSYSVPKYLGAKATGEPPICLSVVVPFALREALVSARQESRISSREWFQIDGPYTMEKICLAGSTKKEDFKFN